MVLWTAVLYHVSLQVLMNQLLVELFSGVMIDTYMTLRGVFTGLILLTPVQRTWVENMRVALLTHSMLVPPRPPAQPAGRPKLLSRLQLLFFRLSKSPILHAFFIALTFGNIVTMCLQHAAARTDFERSLRLAEAVFVGLFCCETVIKIVGLGAGGLASWQFWVFDALPLASSAASLSFGGSSLGTLLRLLRLPRLVRLQQQGPHAPHPHPRAVPSRRGQRRAYSCHELVHLGVYRHEPFFGCALRDHGISERVGKL